MSYKSLGEVVKWARLTNINEMEKNEKYGQYRVYIANFRSKKCFLANGWCRLGTDDVNEGVKSDKGYSHAKPRRTRN
jgi:hypothetical protein